MTECQPIWPNALMPDIRFRIISANRTAPMTSIFSMRLRDSGSAGRSLQSITTKIRPIGTLMKKITRHEKYVTISPPSTGPIMAPSGKMLVIRPIGLSRSRPN